MLSSVCPDAGSKGARRCAELSADAVKNVILSRTEIPGVADVGRTARTLCRTAVFELLAVAIEPQESSERCKGSGVGGLGWERARKDLGRDTEDERDKDGNHDVRASSH